MTATLVAIAFVVLCAGFIAGALFVLWKGWP